MALTCVNRFVIVCYIFAREENAFVCMKSSCVLAVFVLEMRFEELTFLYESYMQAILQNYRSTMVRVWNVCILCYCRTIISIKSYGETMESEVGHNRSESMVDCGHMQTV